MHQPWHELFITQGEKYFRVLVKHSLSARILNGFFGQFDNLRVKKTQ